MDESVSGFAGQVLLPSYLVETELDDATIIISPAKWTTTRRRHQRSACMHAFSVERGGSFDVPARSL